MRMHRGAHKCPKMHPKNDTKRYIPIHFRGTQDGDRLPVGSARTPRPPIRSPRHPHRSARQGTGHGQGRHRHQARGARTGPPDAWPSKASETQNTTRPRLLLPREMASWPDFGGFCPVPYIERSTSPPAAHPPDFISPLSEHQLPIFLGITRDRDWPFVWPCGLSGTNPPRSGRFSGDRCTGKRDQCTGYGAGCLANSAQGKKHYPTAEMHGVSDTKWNARLSRFL